MNGISGEIDQIIGNVHRKPSEIYIPCITLFSSFLGEKDKFSDSTEIFFEYSAFHKSIGIELKQRKDPVRVFCTSPIHDFLHQIAEDDYKENKNLNISRAVSLVFSAIEPPLFDSVMSAELSIFEKALILKEECGENANIVILSNHPKILDIQRIAESESGKKLDFKIENTDVWLMDMFNRDSVVQRIVLSMLQKRKELKIGSIVMKVEE